jgi:ribosome maturation factor RimP
MNKGLNDQLEEIAKQVCSEVGVSLYDLENLMTQKGEVISVSISKIGGVTVDDCTHVNRGIGHILEEMDLIPNKYFLEVSSPGLERPLKFKKHYTSAINEKVKIQYNQNHERMTIEGTLLEVNPDVVIIQIGDETKEISFTDIRKARTVFDFGVKKEKS